MSFHDILMEKMQGREAGPTPDPVSLDYDKTAHHESFTIFEWTPKTFKPVIKAVPRAVPPRREVPAPPPEKFYCVNDLDDDGRAKWKLFEKTFAVELGDKTSVSQAMKAFRRFLKAHHPDLHGQSQTQYNFATLVKIKDEFISAIRKS